MQGYLDTIDHLNTRQFSVAVKRLADSFSYGSDKSMFLGSGIEYVQSRPYQWGDPIRAIDWRVTARTGKVFVKEYEAPKRMPCYLLLDTSASMTISSIKKSKYAAALHLSGGLAFACLERISPVGIIGLGSHKLRVKPSLSSAQIWEWLHKLRHFRYDETTAVGSRLAELAPSLTSRTLLILLSDMHDPQSLPALKLLAQKHDCVVLQMMDPAEHGLRRAGFLRAREAETGRAFVARAARACLDTATLADELKRAGIDHMLIPTDQPFVHRARHFFKSRGLLGRGAR